MIKRKLILLLFITILLVSGCTNVTNYDEDYTEKYKDFLDASLGNWKVVSSGEDRQSIDNSFNIEGMNYKFWDIEYEDKNGKKQILQLENRQSLTEYLQTHISTLYEQELKKEINDLPESVSIYDAHTFEKTRHIEKWEKQDNYKDIYNLQNLSFQSIYNESGMYLRILFGNGNGGDKETKEQIQQELKKVRDLEKEILEKIPNVNLMMAIDFGHREPKYSYFYLNGKKVDPKPDKKAEFYSDEQIVNYKEFAFRDMLVESTMKKSLLDKIFPF